MTRPQYHLGDARRKDGDPRRFLSRDSGAVAERFGRNQRGRSPIRKPVGKYMTPDASPKDFLDLEEMLYLIGGSSVGL